MYAYMTSYININKPCEHKMHALKPPFRLHMNACPVKLKYVHLYNYMWRCITSHDWYSILKFKLTQMLVTYCATMLLIMAVWFI